MIRVVTKQSGSTWVFEGPYLWGKYARAEDAERFAQQLARTTRKRILREQE